MSPSGCTSPEDGNCVHLYSWCLLQCSSYDQNSKKICFLIMMLEARSFIFFIKEILKISFYFDSVKS